MKRPHHTAVRVLARAGYGARGLIYLIIGGLTVYASFYGGDAPDSKGAVATLLGNRFGDLVAIALLVGLAGYVTWRFVQSVFDTDDHGLDPKGLAIRGGLLASCVSYGLLAAWTFSRWQGGGGGGGGESSVADTIAGFIGHRVTAVVLAITFAIVAFAHIKKAWQRGYREHFDAEGRSKAFVDPISRVGLTARGAVFVVLAALLGWRAYAAGGTSGKPPGLQQALTTLRELPAGSLLLAAMGAGLMCFAAYSFIEARYRRINVEDA